MLKGPALESDELLAVGRASLWVDQEWWLAVLLVFELPLLD